MTSSNLGTVLVTGGSGFLGSHIVQRLLEGNHASAIIVTSRNPKPHVDPRVTCHAVNIASKESVDKLFSSVQPNVVIHTASPHWFASPSELHAGNVQGTQNLINASKTCKDTKAFIYTSSNSAVHATPSTPTTEEQSTLHTPETAPNVYAETKALAEALVLSSNSPELKTAVLRVPGVYGERDTNFIAQIVDSIRKNQHSVQIGPDSRIHEFVYAASAAEAHVLAAKALLANTPGVDGEAFFITDNAPSPFFAFYRRCCATAGHPVAESEIKVVPFWAIKAYASVGEWVMWVFTFGQKAPKVRRQGIDHLDRQWVWSCEKAERVLGYRPVLGQDDAIRVSMEWGMKNL